MESDSIDELKEIWDKDETIKVRELISKEDLEDRELNQPITLQVELPKLIFNFIETYTDFLGISKELFLEKCVMSMVETILKELPKLPLGNFSKLPLSAI